MNTALANAKIAIDVIKTDAQLTAEEELAAAKRTAKSALLSYKDTHDYRAEQKAELSNAIDDGIAAINAATNTDEVAAALEAAKAVMDAIKTDAQLTAEEELAAAKADAKAELDSYKNADDYRDAQKTELADAIAAGKTAIDNAADTAAVAAALANAKIAINAIKTDAELTAEEIAAALAQAKTDAKAALDSYKNADDYRAAEQADLADAIAAGKEAIENAADIDAVAAALAAAKTAIDAIKTDAELTAEEEAAQYGQDWQSVTIDDQISINFILNTARHTGLQSITIHYVNQDKEVTNTVYVDVNELVPVGDFYKVTADVAPAQIGDTVTITIVDANGTATYSTSIADYCKYLLDGDFSAEVKVLAAATLEYGQAANDYFGYADAFATTDAAQAAVDEAKAITNTLSVTGEIRGKLASAAFMALTKPEFRFYTTGLTEEEAVELNDQITVSGNASARFVKNPASGAILLEVTGIEAANMDEVITVTVGDLGTITFSGNDFARMMANSGDESIQTLGAALYLYGAAANALFA